MSCVNNIVGPYGAAHFDRAVDQEPRTGTTSIDLAWDDVTWLLFAQTPRSPVLLATNPPTDSPSIPARTSAAWRERCGTLPILMTGGSNQRSTRTPDHE